MSNINANSHFLHLRAYCWLWSNQVSKFCRWLTVQRLMLHQPACTGCCAERALTSWAAGFDRFKVCLSVPAYICSRLHLQAQCLILMSCWAWRIYSVSAAVSACEAETCLRSSLMDSGSNGYNKRFQTASGGL